MATKKLVKSSKIVFQITPDSYGIRPFENGDIPLELPAKNRFYLNLIATITNFANLYAKKQFPDALIELYNSGLLRGSEDRHHVYYAILTDSYDISKEILLSINQACFGFLNYIFDFNQTDLFNGVGLEETQTITVESPAVKELAKNFIKQNKKNDLTAPITISSDLSKDSFKVTGQIKAPAVRSEGEIGTYDAKYYFEAIFLNGQKVKATPINFEWSKGETEFLIAENNTVFNNLRNIFSENNYFKGKVVERARRDKNGKIKYLTEVEAWSGPTGSLDLSGA